MKRITILGVSMALAVSFAATSFAAPINTTLTLTPNSTLNVEVVVLGALSDNFDSDLTGTVNTDIDWADLGGGPEATGLTINSADIDASDGSLSIDLGILGMLDLGFVGAGLGASGPPALPLGGGQFDIAGTVLAINQGAATFFAFGSPGTFDFEDPNAPVEAPLPSTTVTVIEAATSDPNTTLVTLQIPIDISLTLTTDPVLVEANLVGLIEATGVKTMIPEPGTIVLLGIGILGLVPIVRRRNRK